MRVLICDDDAHVRGVMRTLVTQRGHEVVGEADTALEAYSMLASHNPDAAIVDLALRVGSGRDVAQNAASRGCRVIVFSAFLDGFDSRSLGVVTVLKPDFGGLESALDALASAGADGSAWRAGQSDRRTTTLTPERVSPASAVEESGDFFRALGEAHSGDTLLVIDVDSPHDGDVSSLAVVVRAVVRGQDHLMRRGDQIAVLLVDGLPDAGEAVLARLRRATDGSTRTTWTARHAMVNDAEIPADTYQRLRSST